jgi:hypothetical protein
VNWVGWTVQQRVVHGVVVLRITAIRANLLMSAVPDPMTVSTKNLSSWRRNMTTLVDEKARAWMIDNNDLSVSQACRRISAGAVL